jgi:ubiquinone/menaquinone biosynthesis C-methylase UbiE
MTEPRDVTLDVTADVRADVRAAYDATGAAWDSGPRRVYDQLAGVLLDQSPASFDGAVALDAGAGTGAAADEMMRRGAHVTAIDLSAGMLQRMSGAVAVGDVVRLPIRSSAIDITVAAFVLNHLPEPVVGLRELARVTRRGGVVLVSVFGQAPAHPSKAAIDEVATRYGFATPDWYLRMKDTFELQTTTPDALRAIAREAGLVNSQAGLVTVTPAMTDNDVVNWRLGMAHLAPFVARLPPARANALADDACAAVAGMPPLEITMVTLTAVPSQFP